VVASIFPESAEAIRSKLGVEHGVLDVFVPRVVLDGVSVLTVVGELELDRRESGGASAGAVFSRLLSDQGWTRGFDPVYYSGYLPLHGADQ
jgi:hypothetical protein